jgi:hypothetical protein
MAIKKLYEKYYYYSSFSTYGQITGQNPNISLSFVPNKNSSGGNVPLIDTNTSTGE